MDQKAQETDRTLSYGLGLRHVQALMLFLVLLIAYAMRVNMSIAIVAMTDSTKANQTGQSFFDWDYSKQSVILSSFFWGYVILQIPAGEFAARFGGKILLIICVGVNSVTSLMLPITSYYGGWLVVCLCRILQGLAQGVLFPSTHHLLSKWMPLEERSRLGTFVYAGSLLGTALQLMIGGFEAAHWGWQSIFYVIGTLGAIWTAVYIFFGADSPHASKMISEAEKSFIQNSLGQIGRPKKLKTPWKSIWTSLPFISLIVVHCCQNWGFFTLLTQIPSYMNKVLGVNIKANGVMSACPYIAMFLLSFPVAYLADLALKKKWFSVSVTRKLSNSLGHYGPAIALLGLSYAPVGNVSVAVLLLTLVVGLNAGFLTGLMLVHIDMSPNFAGCLMGITNFFANIISIIAPIAAGAIMRDETDPAEWRKVFYVASAIYVFGNTFFVIFGTSKVQKWNEVSATTADTANSAVDAGTSAE